MRGENIELEPPRAQVKAGRLALTDKLELVEVDQDIFGVAERLKKIDPGLHLSYNQRDKVFVLQWRGLNEQGEYTEDLVGAYTELDGRLVNLIEKLAARENRNRYDLVKELDRLEAQKDHEAEQEFYERVGPAGEALAHALRKDLGVQNRAYMSGKKGKQNSKRRRKR